MRTVDEFNTEKMESRKKDKLYPKLAGVACTRCKEKGKLVELLMAEPIRRYLSNPPKYKVVCPNCKWTSYMII